MKRWMLLLLALISLITACKKDDSEARPVLSENLIVPTAFSPNGDGVDDEFVVISSGIQSYSLKIFDQENVLLFSTNNVNTSWDGTFKGKDLPSASYPWIIRYVDSEGEDHVLNGSVELVR